MKKLGLAWQPGPWHNSRDRMAECAGLLALVAASCERIANEVFELSRSEVDEVREPAPDKAVSSSTMPHKRNPVISQRVCVAARQARALAQGVTAAMVHQHERDGRALWSEMLSIPDIFVYTGCAVNYTVEISAGLEVRPERMLANLRAQGEAMMSEWLMFRLAGSVGRGRARSIVERVRARTDGDLVARLREDEEAAAILNEDDYRVISRPEENTGHCRRIAEEIIAAAPRR
jgi:adenylosuccinate lyase